MPPSDLLQIHNLGKRYAPISLTGSTDEDVSEDASFGDAEDQLPVKNSGQGAGWALRNISTTIASGDRVALIGSNGAGKTTFLRILAGLVPPTEGIVRGRGRVVLINNFLRPFSPTMTARANLEVMAHFLCFHVDALSKLLSEIAAFAGINGRLNEPAGNLTNSMYARVAATALLHMDPAVILIDDNLRVGDEEFRYRLQSKLKGVLESGVALIFAGHKLVLLEELCNRCFWLKEGHLHADGPISEVMKEYKRSHTPIDDAGEVIRSETRNGDNTIRTVVEEDENNETTLPQLSTAPSRLRGRAGTCAIVHCFRLRDENANLCPSSPVNNSSICVSVEVEALVPDILVDMELCITSEDRAFDIISRPSAAFPLSRRRSSVACSIPVRNLTLSHYICAIRVVFIDSIGVSIEYDSREFHLFLDSARKVPRCNTHSFAKRIPMLRMDLPWSMNPLFRENGD